MTEVLNRPEVRRLLSDEHFSVDGTRVEVSASMKSFRPRDEGGDGGAGDGRNRDADSAASSAGTTRTPRPLTVMRGSSARATARRVAWPISGIS
jgi:hypothetical protein